MALPTNIVATPNTSLASELPRTVTITGTDIFERPYSTANEQFTQAAPDVLAANWIGGATQVDGVIGKAFDGNNSDSYVNISSKIPDYKATNFIGVSFWTVLDSVDNDCLISLQKDSDTSNRPLEIHVNSAYNMYLATQATYGQRRLGNSMPSTGVPLHIFAWVQFVGSALTMGFYINGVAETVLNGANPGAFGTETADGFRVGGRIHNGNLIQPSDAKISNLHISNNPLFKNELAKYMNLPTVEVN
tara:strand:- start:3443 stop:4183 length:741 start_codon:yes stop_codon:yes gene_type:complete